MERKVIYPAGVIDAAVAIKNSVLTEYGADSATLFTPDALTNVTASPISIKGTVYKYVLWGDDNMLPYKVLDMLGSNMVTAQCQAFNVLCCYGQGARFVDRETMTDTKEEEIRKWCLHNSLHEMFLGQSTDMKFWQWTAMEIILSRDGRKIVKARRLDVMHCRLEYAADTRSGEPEHIFYGDWRSGHFREDRIEAIPLLDLIDPLGDLEVRMGIEPDTNGRKRERTRERKFAIVTRMATPGFQYYPTPYYMSIFEDAWYDIYRLIGIGKRGMIKNTSAPRLHIEVLEQYWNSVCDNEDITDPDKRRERIEEEKRNLSEFVCGNENAGKALFSSYTIGPNGQEERSVRVSTISDAGRKEGGNWSDDMSEASNGLCFAFGVHPNLVGATPGKSQMNNSGSDKRELFTLKQAMETPTHDIMAKPYHLILHFNGWADNHTVVVPMIQLTTLDEHRDAKAVTILNTNDNNGDN